MQLPHASPSKPSRVATTLRHGVLLAAAILVAPAFATAAAPAGKHATHAKAAKPSAGTAKKAPKPQKPGPLADFGKADAPPDVVHVANWVSYTHNAGRKPFILIDKKTARMYVFDTRGRLRSDSPVLLGKAVGDDSAPGIGDKPLSKIKEDEKTTPAGRFLAQPGKNTHGDDIIWIDYNAAVSMHRMREVSAEEHRAERMATPEASDNRISYGCVNVPPGFFDGMLKPAIGKSGAYVYVLPETRTPQQQFGSFDVPRGDKPAQVADAGKATGKAGK